MELRNTGREVQELEEEGTVEREVWESGGRDVVPPFFPVPPHCRSSSLVPTSGMAVLQHTQNVQLQVAFLRFRHPSLG